MWTKLPVGTVRNYQAQNFLRDHVRLGDLAFFHHSSCKQPGIVGIVQVVRGGYPDPSAWNPNSPSFDPTSTPERPRWYAADVKLVDRFNQVIGLAELKRHLQPTRMPLLRRGNRLSIMPIEAERWKYILSLINQGVFS